LLESDVAACGRCQTGKMDFLCEIKASEVNVRNGRSGASNRTFRSRPVLTSS
jgi:hypothetical protein